MDHTSLFTPDSARVIYKRRNSPTHLFVADVTTPLSSRRLNPFLESGEFIYSFQITGSGDRVVYRSNFDGQGTELFLGFVRGAHVEAGAPGQGGTLVVR